MMQEVLQLLAENDGGQERESPTQEQQEGGQRGAADEDEEKRSATLTEQMKSSGTDENKESRDGMEELAGRTLWSPVFRDATDSYKADDARPSLDLTFKVSPSQPAALQLPDGLADGSTRTQPQPSNVVLPTGQEVHVMDDTEYEDLRRKLQMQITSQCYLKSEKDETRHQKMQLQQYRAELARLKQLEAEHLRYRQRPMESLQQELAALTQEVADLSQQVEAATAKERHWFDTINSRLHK